MIVKNFAHTVAITGRRQTLKERRGRPMARGLKAGGLVLRSLLLSSLLVLSGLVACDGSAVLIASVEPVTVEENTVQVQSVSGPVSQPLAQPEPQPLPLGPARADEITDLVLVTGQSNALGAGTAFNWNLDAPNDRVMAFTNNGWQVANLNQVWDLRWFPRNDPNTDPSNNFSIHFGKRLVERRGDRVVGFILITAPGKPIRHWQQGGEFFNEVRNKVSRAINELPHKSQLDAILWHQGESDGEDRDEYSTALYDLIGRFRSEPWFKYGSPFICGETARSPVNNQLQKLNRDNDPWTACIASQGLPTIPGTSHFTAASLRTMGKRYADEYLEMIFATP